MNIHLLEIVAHDVDEQCQVLSASYGVIFEGPVVELGNAMVAETQGGTTLSVRPPMHDQEKPATRPYVLTHDIDAAVKSAVDKGAMLAVEPMEIPGRGKCAIYFVGETEYGLWQV